jgi:hypothetical protein
MKCEIVLILNIKDADAAWLIIAFYDTAMLFTHDCDVVHDIDFKARLQNQRFIPKLVVCISSGRQFKRNYSYNSS